MSEKTIEVHYRIYVAQHEHLTALAGSLSIEAYLDELIARDAAARNLPYEVRGDRRGKRGGGRRKK